MWRKGVYRRDHFLSLQRAGKIDAETVRISLQLLDIKSSPPTNEDIEIFEGVSRIFRTSSGVFRTTYPRRLSDLDLITTPLIREIFDPSQELVVEDRAASHGLTSTEWAELLIGEFPKLQFVASDTLLFLVEATFREKEVFVLEPDGTALQCIRLPFVLPLVLQEAKRNIANRWMIGTARRRSLDLERFEVARSGSEAWTSGKWRFRQIPLIHPKARSLERNGHFRVVLGSIFDVSERQCHVLRAMNILTAANFDPERIREAIRAAHGSLVDGGLWIVGTTRTAPTQGHDVSIFQKNADRFRLLRRIGGGAEIEEVVLRNT
jgi:hypothetical protein